MVNPWMVYLGAFSKKARIVGIVLLACFTDATQGREINDELVIECFFIYASILEAAEMSNSNNLFYYAQKRIGWAGGYVQARESDGAFKELFENNLQKNKKQAIQIRSQMLSAINNRDERTFNEIMKYAQYCDRKLGLPVENVLLP